MNWEIWAKLILSLVILDLIAIKLTWWLGKKLEKKEAE